jgi:mannose-1-phosphate guanylyltransferase
VLQTGDTISIPRRAKHRLEGMQDDGIVLEISFGNFDESDIVRLEDDYKRVS